ncbi:MAG: DNA methyltransferase [Chloroflexota bacterium]
MQPSLSFDDFVANWRGTELKERSAYQAHFMELCELVGYEKPTGSGVDSRGNAFEFEYSLKKQSGSQGFADVYLQNHFAIEYKAPGKYADLRAAYDQLLRYRESLNSPPLFVVTDIQNWEIHTNWSNTAKKVYSFTHEEIATRSVVRDYLRWLFFEPQRLHPNRNKEQVTADAANAFKLIAENMREWEAEPDRIADFLVRLVFCLFAEDVGLLPLGAKGETGIFSEIVEQTRTNSNQFQDYMGQLFRAMETGGNVLYQEIPYFNGSLFEDVRVEDLKLEALTALENACALNWESVEPAIFGTLFERSLDPAKRAQLGAHYTSREDILLIVEPVLMRPLEREWERIRTEAEDIRPKYDAALETSNKANQTRYRKQLEGLRETMLEQLRDVTVLDPACGSGNFLYVALQKLMDMEKAVIKHEVFMGLQEPFPEVHPKQMHGIEINPIAHALASIVVWIGYLQWRRTNGYLTRPQEPILQNIKENILNMDAILAYDTDGKPIEPEWAEVDVIIGNPPFLGAYKMRGELGDKYLTDLHKLFKNRIAGSADLVTYWFELARKAIKNEQVKRVGLLSTNSIRGGSNREVLESVKETGDIFFAWSDREWTLEGANVRVSMIGFDDGTENERILDDEIVGKINSDLTASVDITSAKQLTENENISFKGVDKSGKFDISASLANEMISANQQNEEVVRIWFNGRDMSTRPRNMWIIDFDEMDEKDARQFKEPMTYVEKNIKPKRLKNNEKRQREYWWQFARPRPAMREAVKPLERFIVTTRHSKYRNFVWLDHSKVPDSALVVIARDDDYFFGVLQSKFHELWGLKMGTELGPTPRYTPTTTFETFPFPWVPGAEDTSSEAYQRVSVAAKQLHVERDAWLNPNTPKADGVDADTQKGVPTGRVSAKELKKRTLTNLYNALAVFRGEDSMKTHASAGNFAPRLAELHRELDEAVCDAYGWDYGVLEDEEAILRGLLDLNLARASDDA